MFKKIIEWFNKPYYFNESNTFKFNVSIGIGAIIFILLTIFRPADIKNTPISPDLFRLLVSLITVFNLLFFFFIVVRLFPKFFNNDNWTVGRHFTTIICLIMFSSIIRWWFVNYILKESHPNIIGFFKMVYYSFIIGILPTLTYIYFDEKYHYKKFKKESDEIMASKTNIADDDDISSISKKIITIYSTNKNDSISFKINDLLYVTTESNYASFYIKENKEIKEYILRLQLKVVEEELKQINTFTRCHKSYIVNKNAIIKLSGNARGYFLNLRDIALKIPISRKFSKKEIENMISH